MANDVVRVDDKAVELSLNRFAFSLGQRQELLKVIGQGQIVSVYRTFDEQGSPSGSWAPLAPSTLKNKRSKASAGRKILILSGKLRNSIRADVDGDSVIVGTNLVYARVQQEGSGDGLASVDEHTRYTKRLYLRPLGTGTREITDSAGRNTKVKTKFAGPKNRIAPVAVRSHKRAQNIPARPYLVFRPEDSDRIAGQVNDFAARAARDSGLNATGGAS